MIPKTYSFLASKALKSVSTGIKGAEKCWLRSMKLPSAIRAIFHPRAVDGTIIFSYLTIRKQPQSQNALSPNLVASRGSTTSPGHRRRLRCVYQQVLASNRKCHACYLKQLGRYWQGRPAPTLPMACSAGQRLRTRVKVGAAASSRKMTLLASM